MKRSSSQSVAKVTFLTIVLSLLLTGLLTGCGGGAPNVDWELQVTGDVGNPITLSYADLVAMEQIELDDIMMEKSTGEDEVTSWSGPALDAILTQAEAGDPASITAIAADGYAVDITNDELQGAIVALKRGDEWITEAEPDRGPIRLVTPETPANRWVFQLREIQVNQ
ncbi:MAG: molybdopterin-dependent oxidoreductase [Anaerolineae bacterium]